jgi:hypothetical protein
MTDGLERIEKLFEKVRSKVAHCRNEATSDMADIQDAYSRLYRLRERYRYEAPTLDPTERAALRKVFEDDTFIEGMGRVRGIGDHVETGCVVLRHIDNSPFTVTAASSAAAVFADRCVDLPDTDGHRHRVDHLEWLTEAEQRIGRAIEKAKGIVNIH